VRDFLAVVGGLLLAVGLVLWLAGGEFPNAAMWGVACFGSAVVLLLVIAVVGRHAHD